MSFNQTKFFENLEYLCSKTHDDKSKKQFIYKLLGLVGVSKSTITDLKKINKSRINVAYSPESGGVAIKQRLYFQPISIDESVDETLASLVESPAVVQNKIRIILVTDFKNVLAYDKVLDDTLDCDFSELYKYYSFLLPLAGLEKTLSHTEHPADVRAAENMGRLFDHIRRYNDFSPGESAYSLNIFLTRLLFCFFADNTGIFKQNQFYDALSTTTVSDGSDVASFLQDLFVVLDTPTDGEGDSIRQKLPHHLASFPYVNGRLFSRQYPIPNFNSRSRRILIECAKLNWSKINPDIFGSMFQAVIDPKQRGNLGQHYTSVSNIMKVLGPLFIDGINDELNFLLSLSDDNRHKNNKFERLSNLLERIASIRVIDNCSGGGAFLSIAYKQLRQIEIQILLGLQNIYFGQAESAPLAIDATSSISLDHFCGIEIDHFATQIAKLSMWISEHQMNTRYKEVFGYTAPPLPLKESARILHGNSLQMDWNQVYPNNGTDEIYIIGNPPFNGGQKRSKAQDTDMEFVFKGFKGLKTLDFAAAWFYKGAKYISNSNAKMALISTNSIVQGEQVGVLWDAIFKQGVFIDFAYQTFQWKNHARDKARVHVVIVGLASHPRQRIIFKLIDKVWHTEHANNISPYLVAGANTVIKATPKPIHNHSPMVYGSMPIDGGHLLLTTDEKNELIERQPLASSYIRRIVGAKEFTRSQERWCLWFDGCNLEELLQIEYLNTRINAVKEYRLASSRAWTKGQAATPHLFAEIRQPNQGSYILIPSVTSQLRAYIPIGFLDHKVISTNLNLTIPNGTLYEFGILTSAAHNDWVRLVAGRMKSDYRYSATVCYNTFPFPKASNEQIVEIETLAEDVLMMREEYIAMTLSQLYAPSTMPHSLKLAHTKLDLAVDRLYSLDGFRNTQERTKNLLARYDTLLNKPKRTQR